MNDDNVIDMRPPAEKEDDGPQTHATHEQLGMSEIGAVLGLSPWEQPADVWMRKTNPPAPGTPERTVEPIGDTSPLYWGLKLERSIAEAFGDHMGVKVRADGRTYRHENMRTVCHLDYRVEGEPFGVECKHPGLWSGDGWGEPGTDEIPDHYLAQVHGQMWHVPTLERVYVPRLMGHRFSVYVVDRNPAWFPVFAETVEQFWEFVDSGTVPPIDYGHKKAVDTINALHGEFEDLTVYQWSETEQALTNAYDIVRDRRLALEKAESALKAELLMKMGNASFAKLPDGRYWKRKRTTVQPLPKPDPQPYMRLDFRVIKKLPKGIEE